MTVLVIGLLLFLSMHSIRIVADGWRSAQIARLGEKPWKGLYTLVSLVGFGLIIWGYGLSRASPVDLWNPPPWTRHLTVLLTIPAFILITAAYVPGNRIKAAVGHPMVLGVKVWAFAHLLSNGRLGDVLLFGAFLVWSALSFRAARGRDRAVAAQSGAAQTGGAAQAGAAAMPASPAGGVLKTVVIGLVIWVVFGWLLHGWLIGVNPFA